MALNALKIQTADLVGKLVAQLSNRPTNPIAAGGDNLTAQEVKDRYDAYGHLLKDRFNALVDALVADPAVDTDALANYIKVYLGDPAEDDPLSLADALAALVTEIAKKYEKPEGGIPATDLAPAVTTAIDGKYEKPGTGIPATDLSTDAQTALGKADTAYQKPSGGIPASDLAEAIRTILTNAVSQSEFAPVKALAENADKVLTAANYEALSTMLNAAAKTDYKVGQKILIGAGRVPDVWIYFVHDAAVSYTFTTNLAFQTALESNTLQIGYYALRPLEAKTNLEGYATETYVGNAISGNIDATLSTTGKSADAKAVGDAIDALIDALVDGVMAVAEATYAESATYAQQAGIASQINTDREIEGADTACPPVVFGTVGGAAEVQNGKMPFTEVHGYTIKWNQHARELTSTYWYFAGGTGTISDGVATFTASAQYGALRMESAYRHIPVVSGHKFLLFADVKLTTATDKIKLALIWNEGVGETSISVSSSTSWQRVAGIVTNSGQSYNDGFVQVFDARTADWDAVQVKNICCFDLTEIYGAGKEPTTVAEFVRDFQMPYYPYNAGTLLSSKSSSVDFVKRNQWDEKWELGTFDTNGQPIAGTTIRSKNFTRIVPNTTYYFGIPDTWMEIYWYDGDENFIKKVATDASPYAVQPAPSNAVYFKFRASGAYGTTYNHDICIYVNWETPGLPYVPYSKQHITLPNLELRSAGSAYDVLYQQGGGKRRIGVVDLGALNWSYLSATDHEAMYTTGLASLAKHPASDTTLANIECVKFDTVTRQQQYNHISDGIIALSDDGTLYVYSSTMGTAASAFKTAMSGVYLYYELATETDITVEENPGWTEYAEIDNFGTVKFNQDLAQDIPVPQAYFVRYTVNLVEFLDSLYLHCGGDVSKLALVEQLQASASE